MESLRLLEWVRIESQPQGLLPDLGLAVTSFKPVFNLVHDMPNLVQRNLAVDPRATETFEVEVSVIFRANSQDLQKGRPFWIAGSGYVQERRNCSVLLREFIQRRISVFDLLGLHAAS